MENENADVKRLVADAVKKFREEHAEKSFSQRHPELGKMLNCQFCSRRHRSSIDCQQVFTTVVNRGPSERTVIAREAPRTRRGVNGAQAFAKKRLLPHHSHRLLELVQLTQNLFPKYFPRIAEPEKATKAARGEAQAILSRKSRLHRRIVQTQQDESRKANRV
jgi:hypothetical protein